MVYFCYCFQSDFILSVHCQVGKRVAEYGGAALIVDYGEERGEEIESAKGEEEEVQNAEDQSLANAEEKEGLEKRIERDTLRAFRHHKQVHPLVSWRYFHIVVIVANTMDDD